MDEPILQFWIDTHKTIRYFADLSRERKLHNFELTMYVSMCGLMEAYCIMSAINLNQQIDAVKQKLETLANENESGADSNISTE